MADTTSHVASPAPAAAPHHGPSYVKVWGILLGLLVVSHLDVEIGRAHV